MIARRDILIGSACTAALGIGEWLKPRRRVTLLHGRLSASIPTRFGEWAAGSGGDIVLPRTPGSLSSRLYSDTVARLYHNQRTGHDVMLLVAYGASQDDQLQLHRPESCYPAVGFAIADRQPTTILLTRGQAIPAVALTAVAGSRVEDILYWTRVGEAMPQSSAEQRRNRLDQAMAGYVGDGMLVRASWFRSGDHANIEGLAAFFATMIQAVPADARAGFIGTERARSYA